MTLFPKVVAELRERGASDVLVFGGGVIPADDIPKLEAAGVEKIFTPGANTGDIAEWLRARLAAPPRAEAARGPVRAPGQGAVPCPRDRDAPGDRGHHARGGAPRPRASWAAGAVVKVQVQIGGRGKGGGVVLVDSPERAADGSGPHAPRRLQGHAGHAGPRGGASSDRGGVLHVHRAGSLQRRPPGDDDGRGRHGHRGGRAHAARTRFAASTSTRCWACGPSTCASWSARCPPTRARARATCCASSTSCWGSATPRWWRSTRWCA